MDVHAYAPISQHRNTINDRPHDLTLNDLGNVTLEDFRMKLFS